LLLDAAEIFELRPLELPDELVASCVKFALAPEPITPETRISRVVRRLVVQVARVELNFEREQAQCAIDVATELTQRVARQHLLHGYEVVAKLLPKPEPFEPVIVLAEPGRAHGL